MISLITLVLPFLTAVAEAAPTALPVMTGAGLAGLVALGIISPEKAAEIGESLERTTTNAVNGVVNGARNVIRTISTAGRPQVSESEVFYQTPNYTAPSDNTRVVRPIVRFKEEAVDDENVDVEIAGSQGTTTAAPQPDGNDNRRKPSIRERIGDRIAGRKPEKPEKPANKQGSAWARFWWEKPDNNWGSGWKFRNGVRVVGGVSIPASYKFRTWVTDDAVPWAKEYVLGPQDSVPNNTQTTDNEVPVVDANEVSVDPKQQQRLDSLLKVSTQRK